MTGSDKARAGAGSGCWGSIITILQKWHPGWERGLAVEIDALVEAYGERIREQAIRECAALMCGRCAAGEKPSYWDHDDYISNFGPVNAGDWIHPTSEDFDARYCDASYIHSAILAKLAKPAGAKHEQL